MGRSSVSILCELPLRTATRLLAHQQWQRIVESLKDEDGQMTALEVTGVLDLQCFCWGTLSSFQQIVDSLLCVTFPEAGERLDVNFEM